MTPIITFTGVSPRSLGDVLKGYGLMALIGEKWPETVFYWDAAGHLVAENTSQTDGWKQDISNYIRSVLACWVKDVGDAFAPQRGDKSKKQGKIPSKLTRQSNLDSLSLANARFAWAAAVPDREREKADTRSHPWFGAHGQDGSGDYFATLKGLRLLSSSAQGKGKPDGLEGTLFRIPSSAAANKKNQLLKSGGVFFPEPMKRYATGSAKWIHEGDAPVSQWCYALAVYGALSLRGSLRRMRFARSDYPSFPFVFEGANAWEVHLPTWNKQRPRTLREWRMQIAQFQVRVKGDALAANAAEFRAAVAGRGVAAGFNRFYRFVLERRRPGQKEDQYLQQGILRGITEVGAQDVTDIRLLVAPLARNRWLDRLETKRRLSRNPSREQLQRLDLREGIEQAIHAAIDQPGPGSVLQILRALWETNQVLACQVTGGERSDSTNVPPPAPLLDAAPWERALQPMLDDSAEHRIARAVGSILGASERGIEDVPSHEVTSASAPAKRFIGGLLWQLLPLDGKHRWDKKRGAGVIAWQGLTLERDFVELLWRRWLYSSGAGMRHLALRARRTAPIVDIVRLLNGDLSLKLIHDLVPLYALLDWRGLPAGETEQPGGRGGTRDVMSPVPPAYAILRSWLRLAIFPRENEPAESDGGIFRLLTTSNTAQASRAVSLALQRLRIRGLPTTDDENRPFGKSVAQARIGVPPKFAQRLPLALLVPIASNDAQKLASRLLVQSPYHEQTEITS